MQVAERIKVKESLQDAPPIAATAANQVLTMDEFLDKFFNAELFRIIIRSLQPEGMMRITARLDITNLYRCFRDMFSKPDLLIVPIGLAKIFVNGLPLDLDPSTLTLEELHNQIEKEYGFRFFREMNLSEILTFVRTRTERRQLTSELAKLNKEDIDEVLMLKSSIEDLTKKLETLQEEKTQLTTLLKDRSGTITAEAFHHYKEVQEACEIELKVHHATEKEIMKKEIATLKLQQHNDKAVIDSQRQKLRNTQDQLSSTIAEKVQLEDEKETLRVQIAALEITSRQEKFALEQQISELKKEVGNLTKLAQGGEKFVVNSSKRILQEMQQRRDRDNQIRRMRETLRQLRAKRIPVRNQKPNQLRKPKGTQHRPTGINIVAYKGSTQVQRTHPAQRLNRVPYKGQSTVNYTTAGLPPDHAAQEVSVPSVQPATAQCPLLDNNVVRRVEGDLDVNPADPSTDKFNTSMEELILTLELSSLENEATIRLEQAENLPNSTAENTSKLNSKNLTPGNDVNEDDDDIHSFLTEEELEELARGLCVRPELLLKPHFRPPTPTPSAE